MTDLQAPHGLLRSEDPGSTLGGEQDIRETRVERMEFTWFLITYV